MHLWLFSYAPRATMKTFLWASWTAIFCSVHGLMVLALAIIGGIIVVPLGLCFAVTRPSKINPNLTIVALPRWLDLFSNEQEGADAQKSLYLHPHMWTPLRRWLWLVWRNPVSNLRFTWKWFYQPLNTAAVEYPARGANWYMVRQGWRPGWFWDHPARGRYTKFGFRYGAMPMTLQDEQIDWRIFGVGVAYVFYAKY